MSRLIGVSLAAGSALFLLAGAASAQTPPQYYNRPNYGLGYRPELNPYLNLVNTNNNPGLNYFLHTLPEIDRQSTKNIYGAAIGDLELRALYPPPPAASAVVDAGLFSPAAATGHPATFGNTLGYFPTTPGRPAIPATPATQQSQPRR